MIDDDNKGIANLLNLPVRTPVRKPKVETQEDPLLSLSESLMRLKPLELPKSSEPKDEYGYTKKQNREIDEWTNLIQKGELDPSTSFMQYLDLILGRRGGNRGGIVSVI